MKCFYHDDLDGRCAAFWVHLSVGITDSYESEFIEINYRDTFPLDKIQPNEQVYIVDYSISPDEMRKLLEITKGVTWIDHHKTAIEKYQGFEHELRGVRYDGVSGAMLAYCYIHHMTSRGSGDILPFDLKMTREAPMFTKLVSDWDVWKFDYGDDTRLFKVASDSLDLSPGSDEWAKFFTNAHHLRSLIKQGQTMVRFRDQWAAEYLRKLGFTTVFEGHKCFAVNLGYCNSEYFKSIIDESVEIFMPYAFDGNQWTVSLYSKTVDVSEIAKEYGGGGHKGASGFQCKVLPFVREVN